MIDDVDQLFWKQTRVDRVADKLPARDAKVDFQMAAIVPRNRGAAGGRLEDICLRDPPMMKSTGGLASFDLASFLSSQSLKQRVKSGRGLSILLGRMRRKVRSSFKIGIHTILHASKAIPAQVCAAIPSGHDDQMIAQLCTL